MAHKKIKKNTLLTALMKFTGTLYVQSSFTCGY